jgi:hypothetical protein
MKYTIRPRNDQGYGSFSVVAGDAREALDLAKGIIERGVPNVEILDENGVVLDLAELERVIRESE